MSIDLAGALDELKSAIRDVPDFPKPGIVFKDITPLLLYPPAFDEAVHRLAAWSRPRDVDLVVAAEARGFIMGGALARELGAGFVPARKPGKLPADTIRESYDLEYGSNTIEMHRDAITRGQRVLLVDDVLATGGTLAAACRLIETAGGKVMACAVVVDLAFLHGRDRLEGRRVEALLTYA